MDRFRSPPPWLGVALGAILAACCQVDSPPAGDATYVTRVEVAPTRSVIQVLDTVELQARVHGANDVRQDVVWSSSAPTIALVDEGVVTGLSDGEAIVTATSVVDSTVSGSAEVVVTSDVLGLIEARFDIDLLPEYEAVIAHELFTITFVPARHPPGPDIDARTSPPVFLGVVRLDLEPDPGATVRSAALADGLIHVPGLVGQYLSVEYGAFAGAEGVEDPTGGGFIIRGPSGVVAATAGGEDEEDEPPAMPRYMYPLWRPVQGVSEVAPPSWMDPRPFPKGGDGGPAWPEMHVDQPRVIVLAHGRTGEPDEPRKAQERLDTPYHALHYWGFDFVAALLGFPGATSLMTFEHGLADATTITRDAWEHMGYSRVRRDAIEHALEQYRRAVVKWAGAELCAALVSTVVATNLGPLAALALQGEIREACGVPRWDEAVASWWRELDRLVALGPDVRVGRFVFHPAHVRDHPFSPLGAPLWVVMIAHRDGSLRLGEQTQALIHQVHGLYHRLLDHVYGPGTQPLFVDPASTVDPWVREPLLLFVVHSMGGIAARYLLSRPTEALAGATLTAAERDKAADIADRTVALVTLATPHEGTPAGKASQDIADSPYWKYLYLRTYFVHPLLGLLVHRVVDPQEHVTYTMGAHLPATQDTALEFWRATNTGALAPHHAKRTDGSPIPIYALGGRTPTAGFFHDATIATDGVWSTIAKKLLADELTLTENTKHSRVVAEFERMSASSAHGGPPRGAQVALEALGMMIGDGLMGWTGYHWGPVTAEGFDLDLVRRDFVYALSPFPAIYLRPDRDREQDTDGAIPIGSSLATHLGTSTSGYFGHDQVWEVDGQRLRGSWYRLAHGPWDWEHHGSIKFHIPTARDLHGLIDDAGPYVGVAARSSWFPSPARIDEFVAVPDAFILGTQTQLRWQLSATDYDHLTCWLDVDGDGRTDYHVPGCGGGTFAVSHMYTAPGPYTARLTVTDGGEDVSATTSVSVLHYVTFP